MRRVKRLFLIRHAKSSWGDPELDDFDRPLNKRGKKDGPEMAARLAGLSIMPDILFSSPAKRAKKTARYMAKGTGFPPASISFDHGLYLGSLDYHLDLLEKGFRQAGTVFLVGHNYTITELGEYLSGTQIENIPTCGVVAIEYGGEEGFSTRAGCGRLLFFDFPKNRSQVR